jgi:hypothetical protein
VFWSRSNRQARRQQVLDELLTLEPGERRGRLELAVTAGDVRAGEVDAALQLVNRLDALRVMVVPAGGLLPGGIVPIRPLATDGAGVPSDAAEAVGAVEVVTDEADPEILVEVGVPATNPWLDSAPLPVDAVEAAARLISHDLAARRMRMRAATRSSRQRRLRHVAGERLVRVEVVPALESLQPDAESEPAESWPSISWLRP